MFTFWACMRCNTVFKINSKVNKYLKKNHENPFCCCGCRVTKQVTEFHFQQYELKKRKKVKQSVFVVVPGLADDPRFEFLNEPYDSVWRNDPESE